MINYKNVKPLAVITARGGSKRLPRKNILELEGEHLLQCFMLLWVISY